MILTYVMEDGGLDFADGRLRHGVLFRSIGSAILCKNGQTEEQWILSSLLIGSGMSRTFTLRNRLVMKLDVEPNISRQNYCCNTRF